MKPVADSLDTYDDDELEFLRAIQDFQARTSIRFPTWSQALRVLKDLGYRKGET